MATIGQRLPTPEPGWKRYDDRESAIQYIGTWLYYSTSSAYSGGLTYTRTVGDRIKFFFKGTKIRIINHINVDNSDRIKIVIDDIIVDYINLSQIATQVGDIFNCLVYEKTSLEDRVHTVEIIVENSGVGWLFELDAIDIDDTGRLFHPDEVTDIKDLDIGKRIRCHYVASSGQVGMFSRLGEETSDLIPPTSSATPNGDFYFICVDRDCLGQWKLIADRNIQHSISWDTLNSEGIASGSGISFSINKYTANFSNGSYIFVDAFNGNDNTGDGSKERPFKTIQKAISSVKVNNTSIILKPGVYYENLSNSPRSYNGREYALFIGNSNGYAYDVISEVPGEAVINVVFNNASDNLVSLVGGKIGLYNLVVNMEIAYDGTVSGAANNIFSDGYGVGPGWFNAHGCVFNYTGRDSIRNILYVNYANHVEIKFSHCVFNMGEGTKSYTGHKNGDYITIFENCVFRNLYNWRTSHTNSNYSCLIRLVNCIESNCGSTYYNVTRVNPIVQNIEFDEDYHIINTDIWRDAGVGLDLDGTLADIGVYGGRYSWNRSISNIGSYLFTIRLLTGGISSLDKDNEWDQYIVNSNLNGTIAPGDNNVWNWSGLYSWTSTVNTGGSNTRIVRGNSSVSNSGYVATSSVYGFRPVLLIEILKQQHNFTGNIDKNVVHKDSVTLFGTLSALDRYTVSYQILLNDQVIYEVDDFLPIHDINITIPSDNMVLGSNVIKLVAIDNTGDSSSYWIFTVTKVNTVPFITASMQGLTLNIRIDDPETDNVKFKIELNGNQVFPPSGYTNFRTPPVLYQHIFKSSDVNIGSLNTLVIYAVDDLGSETTHQLEFIGEYSGLMFADSDGNYYSTDLGEVLKYLDFGGVIAGQTTLSVPIRLINKNGFKVTNIILSNDNNTQPPGVRLEMSKSDLPFIPETELFYPIVLNYGDEITFYVRLATDAGTPPKSGKVTIFVKGDPIE